MAKMRKEYNPDRAGRRNRRPVIYIICEGKETEINYFRHFRTRRCLVDVVPISSPCFEYWYLLHFVKQNGYLKDANEVLRLLQSRGRLEKYAKNLDVFQELLPYQPEAIQRAKERIEQLYQDDVIILSRGSNPVTTVYELVEYLNSQNA